MVYKVRQKLAIFGLMTKVKAKIASGRTCEASTLVGEVIAKRSIENKIDRVNFDRGGRLYHGRIKALADAARKEGLNF